MIRGSRTVPEKVPCGVFAGILHKVSKKNRFCAGKDGFVQRGRFGAKRR